MSNLPVEDAGPSSALDISVLCCDEELLGYDRNSGTKWIYPTNYSVRDYQYNITRAALFKNTLVSLPTGLGKTFIAAVVMYNFYRWYPMGKIIFVAPTRPLVAQQIEACYKIMAIPPDHTIEMTGTTQTGVRKEAWRNKRVFFATPQVVQNDLESGACPGELVRCLVIDEAHRAKGRHSYCQLIESLLLRDHRLFRVLALSATPGSKVEDVINVIKNLKIAHLELRTEESLDVAPYSYSRKIQTIVVTLGDELSSVRQRFIDILDIYARRLVQYKILNGNIGGMSKGRIVMLFKEYQHKEKSLRHPQHAHIMRDFTMLITLYHALELLTKHGTRVFLNFFDEHTEKAWIGKDDRITCFLEHLRDDLGTDPLSIDRSTLPDGTIPIIKEDLKYGHPKFDHLKSIIVDHFDRAKTENKDTRAIVFCEYRESVNLVHCLLLQCRPLIQPHIFIGQGSGPSNKNNNMKAFSQKQQLRVMQLFREGTCNVLVSTCVGEEGIDVGSVDLIICFDISNTSPIRLVQRCGRTGRERGGRVVILVTEGREHQTLKDCMFQRDNLNKRILQSKDIQSNLYTNSPRLLPSDLKPECLKMFITVEDLNKTDKNKKQSKIKDLLKKRSSLDNPQLDSAVNEFISTFGNHLPISNSLSDSRFMWDKSRDDVKKLIEALNVEPTANFSRWLEWQRNLQNTFVINHSCDSQILSDLLQFADSKRFNTIAEDVPNSLPIPLTCSQSAKPSQTKKKVKIRGQADSKVKNFDIRNMFMKIKRANNQEEALFQDKLEEVLSECGISNYDRKYVDSLLEKESISPILLDLIVDYEMEKMRISEPIRDDNLVNLIGDELRKINLNDVESLTIPDVPDFNAESFKNMILSLDQFDRVDEFNNMTLRSNFFRSPNFGKDEQDDFDLIDLDQIFDDRSMSNSQKSVKKTKDEVAIVAAVEQIDELNNPLNFFGLDSIDDIFADDSFDEQIKNLPESMDANPPSPHINFGKLNRSSLSTSTPKIVKNDVHNENNDETEEEYFTVTQMINKINSTEESKKDEHYIETQVNTEEIKKYEHFTVTQVNTEKIKKDEEKAESMFQQDEECTEISLDELLNIDDDSFGSEKSAILIPQLPRSQMIQNKSQRVEEKSSDSSESLDQHIENLMQQYEKSPSLLMPQRQNSSLVSQKTRHSESENWSFFSKDIFENSNRSNVNDTDSVTSQDCLKENIHPNESSGSSKISQLKKFEMKSKFRRSLLQTQISDDSDDDFVTKPTFKSQTEPKKPAEKKKRPPKQCEFIDYEAILSEDSNGADSGENDEADTTGSLEGFICDDAHNDTDTSKYLQSVRSPVKVFGGFKIPNLPALRRDEVLSQPNTEQDTSYELDSFCVDNDVGLTQQPEMSELEIAEVILKKRKRRIATSSSSSSDRSKGSVENDSPIVETKTKRFRRRIESDSSADEFEIG